ncbi:MAG: Flp family type IVb pilin [Pseudomonadota bacterium]
MTERLRMRLNWWLSELIAQRSGVTAIEYGLIAASIAVAFIAIVVLVGGDVGNMFTRVSDSVNEAASS